MDNQTFLLGLIPPLLAAVAEIANPVSERVIASHLSVANDEGENVADAIAAIANGSVKVALIIPTWISVTSGFASVFIGQVNEIQFFLCLSAWVILSCLVGLSFFRRINYYAVGLYLSGVLFWNVTKATLLSIFIVVLNSTLVAVLVCVYFKFPINW